MKVLNILFLLLIIAFLSVSCGSGGGGGSSLPEDEIVYQEDLGRFKMRLNANQIYNIRNGDALQIYPLGSNAPSFEKAGLTETGLNELIISFAPNTDYFLTIKRKGIEFFSTIISAEQIISARQTGVVEAGHLNGVTTLLSYLIHSQQRQKSSTADLINNVLNKYFSGTISSFNQLNIPQIISVPIQSIFIDEVVNRSNALAIFAEILTQKNLPLQELQLLFNAILSGTPLEWSAQAQKMNIPSDITIEKIIDLKDIVSTGTATSDKNNGILTKPELKLLFFAPLQAEKNYLFEIAATQQDTLIQGQVDGVSFANTDVILYEKQNGIIAKSRTVTTDNQGRYRFKGIPLKDTYQISPVKSGHYYVMKTKTTRSATQIDVNFTSFSFADSVDNTTIGFANGKLFAINQGSNSTNNSNNIQLSGNLNVGGSSVLSGQLFPNTNGASGQALFTDGNGTLTWRDLPSFTVNTGGNTTLNLGSLASQNSNAVQIVGGNLSNIKLSSAEGQFVSATFASANLSGQLFPSVKGSADQVLTTDAKGILSWKTFTIPSINSLADINLSNLNNLSQARSNLGLGSMSVQNSNSVLISGGNASLSNLNVSGQSNLNGQIFPNTKGNPNQFLMTATDGSLSWSSIISGNGADPYLSNLANVGTARTNLGLGSMATQNNSTVNITGGSVTGIIDLTIADGGTGASTAAGARTNLGLGSIATQNNNTVNITGGSITGITDISVADGGTGSSTAAGARTNLGLGTQAVQNSDSVSITGGNAALTNITITGQSNLNGQVFPSSKGNPNQFLMTAADGSLGWSSIVSGNGADPYLSNLANVGTARTNLGLGNIATQNNNAINITGGSIAGITDIAVADGGTGSSTAAGARINLGLGTQAVQNSDSVSITGGNATLTNVTITGQSNLNGQVFPSSKGNPNQFLMTATDGSLSWSSIISGNGADPYLSNLANVGTARTNLGLGSIATQNNNTVNITGGSIVGITDLAVADGGTGASTAAGARTNLGLGSIATQNNSAVNITGGSIAGITDISVADGGTGSSTAAGARTNLGLGTQAVQNSDSVSITGGNAALTNITITGQSNLNGQVFPSSKGNPNQFLMTAADGSLGWSSIVSGNGADPYLSNLANIVTARTNLGLGSLATQNSNAVSITGGTAALSTLTVNSSAITGQANIGGTLFPTVTGSVNQVLALGSSGNLYWTNAAAGGGGADQTLSNLTNTTTARTNLGLGSIATQNNSAVNITGGNATVTNLNSTNSTITGQANIGGTLFPTSTGTASQILALGSSGNLYWANAAAGGGGADQTLSNLTNTATARTNLGLGSLATQNSNAVAITGGSVSGITDLALADGGTGSSTAAGARTNLGLGSLATQNNTSVTISGGNISGITDLALADGGTGSSTAAGARTNLGLGSLSTQNSNAVSITGGSVSGITDLAVADGGTGASTATGARTNLGLGSLATQNSNTVSITGGNVSVTSVNTTTSIITGQANIGGTTFPTATGSVNQILTLGSSGNLYWANAATNGADQNLSNLTNTATARTNLGLGNLATQNSTSVSITGGNVAGIIDIAVADGGTGSSTASGARTNLGLGSLATQNSSAVSITGGNVSVTNLNSTSAVITGQANISGTLYPLVTGSANQILTLGNSGNLYWGNITTSVADKNLSNLTNTTTARTNLGLGNLATQDNTTVSITGGNVTGLTSLSVTGNTTNTGDLTVNGSTTLGDAISDRLTISANIYPGLATGNLSIAGNLISSSNSYTLGIAGKPWQAIYAIHLVTTSDERQKKEIEPIQYGLEDVLKLKPVSYKWKNRENKGKTIGLIAQEVQEVIKEVVSVADDEKNSMGIQYANMVPILIKAIQEQDEIIRIQRENINTQNKRLENIEELLKKLNQNNTK